MQQFRKLTARSVVASTLLGVQPPELPGQLLVRSGELFGIAEGTTRVALSRMVAAGELEADDGRYRLQGHLLERQARQDASRRGVTRKWNGTWRTALVTADRRSSPERADLRAAMADLRLAELREGVWLRPDNLDPDRAPESSRVASAQCTWLSSTLDGEDDAGLAGRLWDLDGWAARAVDLREAMSDVVGRLEDGDTGALAPGFVLSAAVLRHLVADPLLPPELLPRRWPGPSLREDYERYDAAFKSLWRDWFRRQRQDR